MGGLPEPDWFLDNVLLDSRSQVGPAALWRDWWARQVRDARGPAVLAAAQGFVLTTSQLTAAGVTRSAARAAVRRGDWWIPARGVVALLPVPDSGNRYRDDRRRHAIRAAAHRLSRPQHVVADRSAAVLHGVPTLRLPVEPQLLSPVRDGLGRRAAGHAFGAALPSYQVDQWCGVPVTTVARTIVDLARHDRRGGLVAADAALHERLASRAEIDAVLEHAAGWPGVRTARETLALADPRAESPLESLVRLLLLLDGFPPPELQAEVGGYRVDFYWRAQRLVLEADGREKYTADALWREKRREHDLRSLGNRVERVLWSDTGSRWPATATRLRTAFR